MDLSLKILDPENSGVVDIGHFLFLGTESSKLFRAQIIDLDDDGKAYYIPASTSVDILFPNSVQVVGAIESNRSIIGVTLGEAQLSAMGSGDIAVYLNEPSGTKIAQLGNCCRRIGGDPADPSGGGTVTGSVRTNADDDTAGYLDQELTVGTGLVKEVIDDPTQGKIVKISSTEGGQLESVTNNTGSTIEGSRIVRVVASDSIAYADNTSVSNAQGVGITTASIADGASGNMVVAGAVDATVSGINSGDTLYLDSTNGNITNVAPTSVGEVVYKVGHYNSGKIYIRFELVAVN